MPTFFDLLAWLLRRWAAGPEVFTLRAAACDVFVSGQAAGDCYAS
jgi:hypothetical protein